MTRQILIVCDDPPCGAGILIREDDLPGQYAPTDIHEIECPRCGKVNLVYYALPRTTSSAHRACDEHFLGPAMDSHSDDLRGREEAEGARARA